jgi:integrase
MGWRNMTTVKLANVSWFTDHRGKRRYRFRRKGSKTVMLPGNPGEPEFMRAYEAALASSPDPVGASRTLPGSISAVIVGYYQSAEWRLLAATSQRARRNILERFREKHGDKRAAALEPQHVRAILDARSERPHAARNLLKALKALMAFAETRGFVKADPTKAITLKKPKSDGFKPWSEDQIARFEAHHAVGSKARLAFTLLLYTAQRRGDVVQMGRQHVRDGFLEVRQRKTGTVLHIPITSPLREAMDAAPLAHMTFLTTEAGRPYSPAFLGNRFREWCDAAGVHGVSAHGLRKSAATRLADAGLSAHVIASITGHKSLSDVAHYTRAAEQRRLAESARDALGHRTDAEQNVGKPDAPVGKLKAN